MSKVGDLLRENRDIFGLTQSDIAKKVRVSEQFWGRIEKGDVLLPIKRAAKTAAILKIGTSALFNAYLEDYAAKIKKALEPKR